MARKEFLIIIFTMCSGILFLIMRRRRRSSIAEDMGNVSVLAAVDSDRKLAVQLHENEELIKWQSLLQIWDNEADRFWTRNNIFLVVNGALLIAVTSFSKEPFIAAAISVFGMIFVVLWTRVNRIGKFYVDRWRMLLEELEKPWEHLLVSKISQLAKQHRVASKHRSSTTYMRRALWLMFFLWLTIFLNEAYLSIINNPEPFCSFMEWALGIFNRVWKSPICY